MSPAAEGPEVTAPKDPEAYRPRPLLGVTFWAMLVLMLLCILAGVAIASLGPRLFGGRNPQAAGVARNPALAALSQAALAQALGERVESR